MNCRVPHNLFLRIGMVLYISFAPAGFTVTENLETMPDNLKILFPGDHLLVRRPQGTEFYDVRPATVQANQVVVVTAAAQLVTAFAVPEVYSAKYFQIVQDVDIAINGIQADIGVFFDHLPVDLLGAQRGLPGPSGEGPENLLPLGSDLVPVPPQYIYR